ncbi:alpha-amylase family glycosyl hydrolase [Salinibacterium sp. PAMC 21357]|uniref:alpha-amylase family glycosyl hydrolase n=1 Tax=Salinibacterium sp. PAMC 21357 TaxID=1112215 RepID=UPI000288CA19|nr:alpha-amylase family glycosyl hydrolase [Salinibacterium sp. PAMC 21357]
MSDWWNSAVIYEVYPRSFSDADGDGIGDLRGIIERMPYLESLGIDGIWLTPFQRSPQVDQGYDISDYCDVDPLFGSLADFDELLAAAHSHGIRVLVDIVPNHTSIENPLFEAAVAAAPGSIERDMFHFSEGRGLNSESPPNNWVSVFGGPAWHRVFPESTVDTQWYLHLFSPGQPDWNWENPAVAAYFEAVIRFWFDRGVDGIRVDVAHGLYKAAGMPDSPTVPAVIDGLRSNPLAMDQEPVHEVYRSWRRIAEEYSPARLLVGEVNLEPERSARYTRADELHQTFAFAFAKLGWDGKQWSAVGQQLEAVRRTVGSAPSWALENHDIVRTVTRFGGGALGQQRARAAVVALLGLPGTVYIYQGQELGLPEVDVPVARRADPMWFNGGVSRDGARVPLPWDAASAGSHGFSPVPGAEPWLPVPPAWGDFSIERQELDETSALALFRQASALRAQFEVSSSSSASLALDWSIDGNGRVIARRSDGLRVVIAMGESAVELPAGAVVLSSEALVDGKLPANAAAWVAAE